MRRRLLPLAVLMGATIVFTALGERVLEGAQFSWDATTYRVIETTIATVGTPVGAQALLSLAATGGVAALVAGVAVLVRRRSYRQLAFLAAGIGGMLALDPVLKSLFQRPPVTADGSGYSFPSGTAMVSLAVAGAATVLLERRLLRWGAVVAGGLMSLGLGASVVYLQWHQASDVVAGWCVALGWLSALWMAMLLRDRGERAAATDP